MHIVVIPSWYPHYDGAISGSFFQEQAEALADSGLKVSVAYVETRSISRLPSDLLKGRWKPGFSIVKREKITEYRFRIYNGLMKLPYGKDYLVYRKLRRLVQKIEKGEGEIDLFHLHSYLSHGFGITKIARQRGIPLVLTEHNTRFSRNEVKSYQKRVIRCLLNQCERIIAVGPGLKKALESFTTKDVLLIPNMVDLSLFHQEPAQEVHPFRFLSVGTLKHKKGYDLLIDAFAKLTESHSDTELLIVGEGEEQDLLQRRIDALQMGDRIRLYGKAEREEIPGLMANCHAFILTSRHETFGVVFIEAMASGRPVIATSNPGPASIVTEKTGYLVPNEDVPAITRAMSDMIENYTSFDGEQIRKYCSDNFSKEAVVACLNALYRDISASREKQAP